MKRKISLVMICLFYAITSMFAQLSIGGQRMLDLQKKISETSLISFTVEEMYIRYGKPQRIEVKEAQLFFQNAGPEYKITWYYYDDMGYFLFYYNADNKNEFLMEVSISNRKFIKKLEIPENKEEFIKCFGKGNDFGKGRLNYGYYEGYLHFNFDFENNILIQMQIILGDW